MAIGISDFVIASVFDIRISDFGNNLVTFAALLHPNRNDYHDVG